MVREYGPAMVRRADKVTLPEGSGNVWNEISLAKLTAQPITENTEENNPQQLADTLLSATPQVISVHTVVTDRADRNVSQNVISKIGTLGQNAIERKKDIDGLTLLDGATTSLGGAASVLTFGIVAAASYRITGNATEPWMGDKSAILHSFQIKDLFDELTAGVGTSNITAGPTADVLKAGYDLPLAGVKIFSDDNITIDASDDAKGGVFASGKNGAVVLVQARNPWVKTIRNEKLGGGATEVLHRDEYVWVERGGGVWLFEVYSDALAPTS